MVSYLVREDGTSKLLLESSGAILLEVSVVVLGYPVTGPRTQSVSGLTQTVGASGSTGALVAAGLGGLYGDGNYGDGVYGELDIADETRTLSGSGETKTASRGGVTQVG